MEEKKIKMVKENEIEKAVELTAEDLENVTGGRAGYISCPECGNEVKRYATGEVMCPNCGTFFNMRKE